MREYQRIKAFIIRGGTSKGVFLMEKDLPKDPLVRDEVILRIFGSPDIRQIDGLGGGDPLTSKLAIIKPSARNDADIDYTIGYVGIESAFVDYSGNCGNLSSAVGPFAVDEGLVPAIEPITKVKIFNTNTNKVIEAEVPVKKGKSVFTGEFSIDGVPGTGAKILLNFLDAGGAKTGKLLPTGNVTDTIPLKDGRHLTVSIVDAVSPAIFVKASDLGLTGTELPADAGRRPEILEVMEEIRCIGAEITGIADIENASKDSPSVPKVVIVAQAQDYRTIDNRLIRADSVDLVARTKALAVMHKAFAVSGGICTATAAMIAGTVVHEVVSRQALGSGIVRIGHPSGVLEFDIKVEGKDPGEIKLVKAAVARTARRIMEGYVYIPSNTKPYRSL